MNLLKNQIKHILRHILPHRLPLLLGTTGWRHPRHLTMTAAEAEAILTAIHPDRGSTCLCHNRMEPVANLHVIIPVYNAAPYLQACLDSVYTQETRFSFFVTIIDDGSTDGSALLLDHYLQSLRGTPMYARTEVIHQPNGGLSRARNRGLECIRGQYVTFVDSDDMLLPGALEALMSAAEAQGADIAEGYTDRGTSVHGMACGKVYRARLFLSVHFPPDYWFEDTVNIFYLYPLCHKHIRVPGRHYFYRDNGASIMHSYRGRARAVESLWVSRRVLTDYFASGHTSTAQLFADFLQDALSTATAIHTLGNEEAMRATFVLLSSLARTYFASMLSSKACTARLPYLLRHTAASFARGDYRLFRAAQAAMCPF